MSATHADDRFPIGVVLMLCGFLAWDLGDGLRQRRFLIVLSALVLLRVGGAEAASERLQKIVVAFDRSLELVAPGSKILVAQRGGQIPLFDTLEALPCLAMIERSSLVSTAFSHPTGQVLVVKPPYRAMTSRSGEPPALAEVLHPPRGDGRIYWRNWMRDYDYLYVISAGDASNPAPRRLTLLYRGPHFELYRIRRVQG